MVWACLTPDGIAALEVLNDRQRLNAVEYQRILSDNLASAMDEKYPDKDFVFQQDNAPAHTAKSVSFHFPYNIR